MLLRIILSLLRRHQPQQWLLLRFHQSHLTYVSKIRRFSFLRLTYTVDPLLIADPVAIRITEASKMNVDVESVVK